jgi:hypothetical protein
VLRRKADGRSARFVIVFVTSTVEDPALGAHEGFLDEITPVADAVRTFPPDRPNDLCGYLRPRPALSGAPADGDLTA